MLGDFAQLHRRAEAKLAGRTHLDTTELLQPFQIHQRGGRYDVLLRQIDHVDTARECDVAIFGQ